MKKGFTLIEMLIVIALMGIVFTLAIPAVMKISEERSNTEYKTHMKLVEQAAILYQHRYKGNFDNSSSATLYRLEYKTLLDEGLLEENNISCDKNGYIYYRKNNKNNYTREYYLKCRDKNGVEFGENKTLPSEAYVILENASEESHATINAPTIKGGSNSWTNQNVTITVDNSGVNNVKKYDYYTSTDGTMPARNATVTGSTSGSVTISTNGTTYIWYRVIDTNDNVSGWSNRQVANIDKTTTANITKPTITASDSISSGSTHTADFVLYFGGGNNISGNTYYYGTSSTTMTTPASSINITSANNNTTYYVKTCNGANVCSSQYTTYTVKY